MIGVTFFLKRVIFLVQENDSLATKSNTTMPITDISFLPLTCEVSSTSIPKYSQHFAGVWQHDELGGRGADERKRTTVQECVETRQECTSENNVFVDEEGKVCGKGKLKWGIGKMIAHAPKPPVVIPFCHTGMEKVMPQDPATRKTISLIPIPGKHDVKVQFGCEIDFSDLIEEHELQVSMPLPLSPSIHRIGFYIHSYLNISIFCYNSTGALESVTRAV